MNYMDTRAYLIDPVRKSVFQIKYSYLGDRSETAKAIRAEYVDAINLDDTHCVWVDHLPFVIDAGEGLLRKFVYVWDIKSKFYPNGMEFHGMALVTGVDEEGETVPPTMSFDELNDSLTFHQHQLIRKDMA